MAGVPAVSSADNVFWATPSLASGANTVSIAATDPNGNTATRQYQLMLSGTLRTFSYDANGNSTSDGAHTFEWNARNQLHSMSGPGGQYGFTYDSKGRRHAMTRSVGGTPVSDMRLVWSGPAVAEQRDLVSSSVRRLFEDGEQINGAARFLTRDHLGSVYDETDGSAVAINRTSYDPYGRAQSSTPLEDLDRAFAGAESLEGGSLVLTPTRLYDPETARWLSEDPMGLEGGSIAMST